VTAAHNRDFGHGAHPPNHQCNPPSRAAVRLAKVQPGDRPADQHPLIVEATTAQGFARIEDLVRQYADFPLVTADASVITAAERLGATPGSEQW
jgi:hypothetical protein